MSASQYGMNPPHKQPRVLSCVLCQKRKIKCDRTIPCANCIKANVTCTPSTPAPPRQRSRPRRDLQERLSRCEALLKQYAEKPETAPSNTAATPAKPSMGSGTDTALNSPSNPPSSGLKQSFSPSQASHPGSDAPSPSAVAKMTLDTGAPRFIDTHIWAVLNDEIQVMKTIIEAEDPDAYGAATNEDPYGEPEQSFPNSDCPSPGEDEKPTLDAVQIFKLWQVYLDRVNPLVKVIHAPTLQPYIVQAAADITSIPLAHQALLYSLFGLASAALKPDEVMQVTGMTHEQIIPKFFKDMFIALTRFDFLNRYNMVTLQALIHVLLVQQSLPSGNSAWVLCGSLTRMAVSMGYHRDGQVLKLPPFETEMRRRIWWQVLINDLRLTMDAGLKHHSIPADFDTKMPLNLNDADLFPDATGELQSRDGPTEMAFMLVCYRFNLYFMDEECRHAVEQNILGMGTSEFDSNERSLQRNREMIDKLEEDLMEIERRFIVPTAGKFHIAALGMRPQLISRLRETMLPMQEQAEWGTEIFGPKDNVFKTVIQMGENLEDGFDYMDSWGYAWFMHIHFHSHYLASLSSLLYHRPAGSLSDRAWRLLEKMYLHHPMLYRFSLRRQFAVQAQFVIKAWGTREQAIMNATGQKPPVPAFVTTLKQKLQMFALQNNTKTSSSSASSAAQAPASSSTEKVGGAGVLPGQQPPSTSSMDLDPQQQQQQQQQPLPQQNMGPSMDHFWQNMPQTSILGYDFLGGAFVPDGAGDPGSGDYMGGTYYSDSPY